jgi:hypothetical protein
MTFAPVVVGFQRFHSTDKVEQVEDCVRDTYVSFITVTEVYLVVPGYQTSTPEELELVYQHVFL